MIFTRYKFSNPTPFGSRKHPIVSAVGGSLVATYVRIRDYAASHTTHTQHNDRPFHDETTITTVGGGAGCFDLSSYSLRAGPAIKRA